MPKKGEKCFQEMYASVDMMDFGYNWMLITAEKLGEVKNERKSFSIFKREKKEMHTVKIYKKRALIA